MQRMLTGLTIILTCQTLLAGICLAESGIVLNRDGTIGRLSPLGNDLGIYSDPGDCVVQDIATDESEQVVNILLEGRLLHPVTPGSAIARNPGVGFFGLEHLPAPLASATLAPRTAAAIGSALTTYCTFLPCFLFIFVAAPYIHDLHEKPGIGSALGAVTAAVVGVMAASASYIAAASRKR